ncbi:hypothetical protein [Kingella oralis]|uniref:hypothetical protein n=1 Tax=Kingella oralis TaxID=505 RepID=UPI0034E5DF15
MQMLARYPTLLCFAPCIHAFMPQNLFTRIMNTGSKQKKGDPDVQVWLRQTSRRLHPFFGACELAALRASSDKHTLFPEKRMLRSAGRRGGAAALNSCEALGSLKFNLPSRKPFGAIPNGFVFQAAFVCIMGQPENGVEGLVAKWRIKQTLLVTKMSASHRHSIGCRFCKGFRLPFVCRMRQPENGTATAVAKTVR